MSDAPRRFIKAYLNEKVAHGKLFFFENEDSSHSPNLQAACEKLVIDLHGANITGAKLKRRLNLGPRKHPRRFDLHPSSVTDAAIRAEQEFVSTMLRLGVEREESVQLGAGMGDSQWFPETHDYLLRAFVRFEQKLSDQRVDVAERKNNQRVISTSPTVHAAATLSQILGRSPERQSD